MPVGWFWHHLCEMILRPPAAFGVVEHVTGAAARLASGTTQNRANAKRRGVLVTGQPQRVTHILCQTFILTPKHSSLVERPAFTITEPIQSRSLRSSLG